MITEALSIINQLKLIHEQKFAKVVLDENSKTFIVYSIASKALKSAEMAICFFWFAEVLSKAQLTTLHWNKIFSKILSKYTDFSNLFLQNLRMKLLKNIINNQYIIELIKSKQPLHRPISTLHLVNRETLKTYIRTYLKTGFIWFFRSQADASIIFDIKFDSSFYLIIR